MSDVKCNCGKPIRYSHMKSDGVHVMSCNKHMVCPTYDELLRENGTLRKQLFEIYSIKDTLLTLRHRLTPIIDKIEKATKIE